MAYIITALIILIILDGYIISQITKHEIAIMELLKRHPDMLIEEDDNDDWN